MIFKTTLDNIAKLTTVGVALLFFVIIAIGLLSSKDESEKTILLAIILILIYGFSYAFSPKMYEITEDSIIVKRPYRDVVLKLSQIKSISKIDDEQLRYTVRTFWVGGLFGYFGKFWNKKLGMMTWYATRRNKVIMLTTTKDNKIILTPNKPKKFIAECNRLGLQTDLNHL